MEEKDYFGDEPKKGTPFFLVLGVLALILINNLNVDYAEVLIQRKSQIPTWYLVTLFSVDILGLACLLGIYFFKKIAVYIFPILTAIHMAMHLYYMRTFLYTDVFILFFFIGVGLLVLIPKWKYFK